MSRTEYRFDGLDALEQQLSRMIEEEYPAEFRAMVIQIARELQGKVKEKTPHKTGRLQDSWKVGPIVKKGDTYYIEVYTNVEYAEPVEYGHRTRGGRSFVPGKHTTPVPANAPIRQGGSSTPAASVIQLTLAKLADTIVVREEADIDKIGEKVAKEVVLAVKNMVPVPA